MGWQRPARAPHTIVTEDRQKVKVKNQWMVVVVAGTDQVARNLGKVGVRQR